MRKKREEREWVYLKGGRQLEKGEKGAFSLLLNWVGLGGE